jgi:CMP-N,N'-diacetyllegionaminic acid synthase
MLAIIPARAGSKGVQNKNKKIFCGRPLIEWTIEAAINAKSVSRVLLTSNDEEILDNRYVNQHCDFVIRRPDNLAADDSPAISYVEHALNVVPGLNEVKYFSVLQPTSPLRLADDIDELFKRVSEQNFKGGVTVVDLPHNFLPHKLMKITGGYVTPSSETQSGKNLRQEENLTYVARNGAAVYICEVEHFLQSHSLFSDRMAYWKMPFSRSVDIDTVEDFDLAQLIMQEMM